MNIDNPSEEEIKQLMQRMPRAVTLARVVEEALEKEIAALAANPDRRETRLDAQNTETFWLSCTSTFSALGTRMQDEWIICGPVALYRMRCEDSSELRELNFIPDEPRECGTKGDLLYVGTLRGVTVYAAYKCRADFVAMGVGKRCQVGDVTSSQVSYIRESLEQIRHDENPPAPAPAPAPEPVPEREMINVRFGDMADEVRAIQDRLRDQQEQLSTLPDALAAAPQDCIAPPDAEEKPSALSRFFRHVLYD